MHHSLHPGVASSALTVGLGERPTALSQPQGAPVRMADPGLDRPAVHRASSTLSSAALYFRGVIARWRSSGLATVGQGQVDIVIVLFVASAETPSTAVACARPMLAPLGTVAIRIATELPAISVQSAKRELSTNGLTWCEGGSSSVLLCCGPSCRFTDGLNAPFPHPSYEPPRLVPGRTLDQFGGSLIATVTPLRGRQLDTVALASIASITPNVAYWCWSSAGAPGKRRPCWHPTRSAPSAPRRKRRTIRPQCLPDGLARPRTPRSPQ